MHVAVREGHGPIPPCGLTRSRVTSLGKDAFDYSGRFWGSDLLSSSWASVTITVGSDLLSNFATQLSLKEMASRQATANREVFGRGLVLITPVQKKKFGSVSEKMTPVG